MHQNYPASRYKQWTNYPLWEPGGSGGTSHDHNKIISLNEADDHFATLYSDTKDTDIISNFITTNITVFQAIVCDVNKKAQTNHHTTENLLNIFQYLNNNYSFK